MVAKKTVHSVLSGKFDEDMLNGLSSFIDGRKNSLRLIISFEKWIIPLVELGIPFSAVDFIRCASSDTFLKQTSAMSRNFYEARYAGFDVDLIWNHCKKSMCFKRGNPYDIDSVMKKMGVSRDTASDVVKKRLDGCRQDLAGFISRHGDEMGREKYREFLDKSKTTEENYKKRYGKDWESKWSQFKATRATRSLEHFVKKFGEAEGLVYFEKCNKEYSKKMSLEYLVATLGEVAGQEEFDRRNSKKDSSSREAVRARLSRKLKRPPSEEEVERYYTEGRKKRSGVYQLLIKKFTLDEAEQKYADYKCKKVLCEDIAIELAGRMSMPKARFLGPCSKQSCSFFSEVQEKLGRDLQFGTKSKEISLFDEDNCRLYYYDCFDPESNTLLEFHGSAFHAHPSMSDEEKRSWFTISGHDAESKQKADEAKIDFAKKSGYNVEIIWDKEVKLKHDRDAKIEQTVMVLNENKENLKQR